MKTFPTISALQQRIKRRKTLALATAVGVAGVAGVGGCNLMAPQAAPAPAPAAAAASESVTDDMVQNYTSDIEKALDNIDRKRLSLAHQAGQSPAGYDVAKVTPVKATAAQPATPDNMPLKAVSATPSKGETPQVAAVAPDAAPAAAPGLSMGLPIPDPVAAPASPAKVAEPATSLEPATLSPMAAKTVETLPALQPASTYETIDTPPHGPSSVSPMFGVVLAAPAEPALPAAAASVVAASSPPIATSASAMGAMTAMLAPAPNSAAVVAAPESAAEPTVDDAMAILRKDISAHPTLNTALALALLDGKSTDDITKSLSDPDQKLLADLTAALDSMKTAATAAPLAKRAAPILDAAKHWQAEAELALPRLVLASRVDSYGVFSAVEPTFEQGKKHTVIIYCEVGNFGSKKGDDGWYTTRLTQQESLITEDKLLVWRPNPEEVEDRSLNQRHDFYLVKKLTLPETLAAGKYTLRMDVADVNTGKRSVQSMDIQLVTK